jgi:hypothetical protein
MIVSVSLFAALFTPTRCMLRSAHAGSLLLEKPITSAGTLKSLKQSGISSSSRRNHRGKDTDDKLCGGPGLNADGGNKGKNVHYRGSGATYGDHLSAQQLRVMRQNEVSLCVHAYTLYS